MAAPVTLNDHVFLVGQPEASPAIVFACKSMAEAENFWVSRIRCIDKRSGRVLYSQESQPFKTFWMDIVVDPVKRTVALRTTRMGGRRGDKTANETVTLTFTDRPLVSDGSSIK